MKNKLTSVRLNVNAGIMTWYVNELQKLTRAMTKECKQELVNIYKKGYPQIAFDESISSQARITLNQLYKKYGDKFSAKAKDLKDSNGQEGRPFEARFLQPGLVKYDFGVCLLKKETIDKFIDTFIGKPVIIDHKDDIALEDRKGGIEKIWFNPEDGWYWCSGTLTEKQAVELVEKGYNVSCQYAITDFSINTEGKLHNGNPYDKEILDGNFEHLAIVKNPRYEDAFIAVNAYIVKNKTNKYKPVFDYIRTTKGEPMDKETKGVFDQLLDALKARNEAEDETKDKKDDEAKNKAKNEDKRKIIDEVGGILKGKVDDEIIRTVIGFIFCQLFLAFCKVFISHCKISFTLQNFVISKHYP